MERKATIIRKTGETDIELTLNLDGTGKADINTGVGFFDHMLNNFARHGLFDLTIKAKGDLYVDCHHLIEDVGIVLGQAIKEAVGDKRLSNVMAVLHYQWMKHCLCAPLIYQVDLTLFQI